MTFLNNIWRNVYGALLASRITSLLLISFTQCLTALFLLDQPIIALFETRFLVLLLSTVMIAAAGYTINDYYDQKIDMVNRPNKVIVGVWLNRRWALALHLFLSLTAIFFGFLIDRSIGLFHLISVNILWFYSSGMRKRLLINNLSIGFLAAGISGIVAVHFSFFPLKVIIYSAFSFLSVWLLEIVKDILDLKGEAKHGCMTIPVKWGVPIAKNFIYSIVLAMSALMFLFLTTLIAWKSIAFVLILLPITILFVNQVKKADTQFHYKQLKTKSYLIITLGILSMFFL